MTRKMLKHVYFLGLVLLFAKLVELKTATTQVYPNYESLLPDDRLNLYWDHDQSEITFELHSKNVDKLMPLDAEFIKKYPEVGLSNTSWILFGFSDGQSKADAIVTWVTPDGYGHFSDRNLNGLVPTLTNRASRDSETNSFPVDAFSRDNFSIIKFKRPILACKSNADQDLNIKSGQLDLFFAVGNLYKDNDYFINGGAYESISSKKIQLLKSNLTEIQVHSSCMTPKVESFNSEPTGNYMNQIDLSPNVYRFYWNYTDTDLIGEVHVKTRGWIAFGLSPNGGMDQSDIMVAWINDQNGNVNFTDRFIKGRQLVVDKKQDWFVLSSKQTDSFTVIKFRRSLKLCDPDDRSIQQGNLYIIWAFGPNDPASGQDVSYHFDKRGTKSLKVINAPASGEMNEKAGDVIEIFDISMSNVILPRQTTVYYNKIIPIPKSLSEKRHILKWELILPKLNNERIHHLDTKECDVAMAENEPGNTTYEALKPTCLAAGVGWSVGGELVSYFPPDTGYPIGGDTNYKGLEFDLHYDNPHGDLGYIDMLTVRYYMTKNLRKNELGILSFGTFIAPSAIFVPPGLQNVRVDSMCYDTCTEKVMTGNLTVIRALPHAHTTGIALSTMIIRDGKEIGYLHNMENFDFNYQQSYDLNPYIVLKKGDQFRHTCQFKTTSRNEFTYGGSSTHEEMCITYFTYYPRNKNFRACFSSAYPEDVLSLVAQLNKTGLADMPTEAEKSKQDDLITQLIRANAGVYSLDKYADKMNMTIKERIKDHLENKVRYLMSCSGDYHKNPYAAIKVSSKYVEQNMCNASP